MQQSIVEIVFAKYFTLQMDLCTMFIHYTDTNKKMNPINLETIAWILLWLRSSDQFNETIYYGILIVDLIKYAHIHIHYKRFIEKRLICVGNFDGHRIIEHSSHQPNAYRVRE